MNHASAGTVPYNHAGAAFRGVDAIGSAQFAALAHRTGEPVGVVPIAGDDQKALALASDLIKAIGFEPVVGCGSFETPATRAPQDDVG